MTLRVLSIGVVLAAATFAFADDPAPKAAAELTGKFGWSGAGKAKCKAIDAKQVKALEAGYKCTAADPNIGTASGKPLFAECKAKKGRASLVVFSTMADCNEERETQAANAD